MFAFFLRAYDRLFSLFYFLKHPSFLLLRVLWGYRFFQMGMEKIQDPEGTVVFFQNLGMPFAETSAPVVAVLQAVGGLSLMAGLAARLFALPLLIMMCIAYGSAHQDAVLSLFNDPDYFISQEPYHYMLTALLVLLFGPGGISFDAWIRSSIENKIVFNRHTHRKVHSRKAQVSEDDEEEDEDF